MRKTIAYRLFKAGSIPGDVLSQAKTEGILLSDEGISGAITFRNFRAPGRYHGWRRNWFSGSLVLTKKHFLAFQFSKPVIGVAWKDPRVHQLHCSLKKPQVLLIAFDASTFNDGWSGQVEVAFKTPLAPSFREIIERYIKRTTKGSA